VAGTSRWGVIGIFFRSNVSIALHCINMAKAFLECIEHASASRGLPQVKADLAGWILYEYLSIALANRVFLWSRGGHWMDGKGWDGMDSVFAASAEKGRAGWIQNG
jgi:hypothetical protein